MAVALLSGSARALVVADGTSNTTSAGFNDVFYNVGRISDGTAVYLGDGWVLTAGHLTVPLTPGTGASFYIPGVGTESFDVLNTLRITSSSSSYPGIPDLQLVQLGGAPPLPSIFQSIPTSSPSYGAVVAMVGNGGVNSGNLYWNAATSSSNGSVNLGTSSSTPYSGTPNPIPSDTYWSSGGQVPQGTYQDAGFAVNGANGREWGESVVTFNNTAVGVSGYNSNTFITTFYNSTYDPPSSPTVAAEVATIGSNMASVALGDSGGPAFTYNGSGWSLAGILESFDEYSRTEGTYATRAYGDVSIAVDLSTYRSAILSVINSTVTWTDQAGNNTWDTNSANWTNAGHNGATAFTSTASTANAIFGNTNPLYGIPLNSSLQSIAVQSGGVSIASITFTNTGSANGGTDYVIGGGAISGSPLFSGNGSIAGNNSIVLAGNGAGLAGAVYLTGANSFTGGVVVEAGRLNLQNAFALGNSSGVVIDAGAALELQTTSSPLTSASTSAIPLTLNGSGIFGSGALNNISGNNTYAGLITLLSSVTIGSSSTAPGDQLSITGGIDTVDNSFTFTGPGNTTISNTPFTSVYEQMSHAAGTLIKTGTGTLTLNFAASASPTSDLLMEGTAVVVAGGTFRVNGASSGGGSSQTVASLSINSGASQIVDTSNGVNSNFVITSPTITRAVGGTVDFTLPTVGNIGFVSPPTPTNGILGGWATVSGGSWATLSGSNIAPYTGAMSVSSGSQALAAGTNYDVAGSFTASGAANSLRFVNGATPATVTLSGTVPITTGGILIPATVTSASTITGGTLQGAAGTDLVVIQNSAAPLTISSTIADNGSPTGLTKSGSGALTLSSMNSYTGPATLNAGTLNINNAGALGGGALIINGGMIDNTFGGSITTTNPETWNGSFAFHGTYPLAQTTGAITLTSSPTITINSNTLSIGGAIGGGFGLTLAGNGTLALSGANTFTGGMTINGGTLSIGSIEALNSSAPSTVAFGSAGMLNLNGYSVSVGGLNSTTLSTTATIEASATSASATLTINGVGNYLFAGAIVNGGAGPLSLIKTGSGTQILSGLNTYTGGTTINSGVLQFNADADIPLGSAGITVGSAGTIAAGSAIEQTFLAEAQITSGSTGSVALAANSSNNLDFSSGGANLKVSLGSAGSYTYSGTLTPYGTNYNLGGGGGLLTFSGPLSGANSVTLLNGGDVALTATTNSYSSGTTIDSGTTLLISADTSSMGSGSTAQLGQVPASATTNITINGGTLQSTATFTLNSNRGIALGSSGGTIDVDGVTSGSSNTLTYNGVITGTGSLTLTDTGTLVLGGSNAYTGSTNINSGTLRAGIADTIPQSSGVTIGLGGTLQLNGLSQSIGSLTGGGVVTDNSSTSATLTVGNDNTSPAAYSGVISDTNSGTTGALALYKVGTGTLSLTGLNTYSGGTIVNDGTLSTVSGGTIGSGSLRIAANSGISSAVSIGTSQSVASLTNSASGTGATLLSIASGTTLTSTGALTNTGAFNIGTTGQSAGSLIVDAAPSLAKNSSLLVNAGAVQFNVPSGGMASIQSGVTVTVASAATLQLAGSASALSDGSAINPSDGQLATINNNGSTASGGGLSVTGTNQSVGTITGSVTSNSGSPTTYSGDTVVAAGASLTATQILQNTLTIGAGATVTIRPSGPGITTSASETDATASDANSTTAAPASGTSLEVEEIQNRIAVLEQLEAADSASNPSPLDDTPSALIGSTSSIPNPANADLTGDSQAALVASEITLLQSREDLLLASEENSSSALASAATDFSSSGPPSAGAAVPEPSALALLLIGVAAAWPIRRRISVITNWRLWLHQKY